MNAQYSVSEFPCPSSTSMEIQVIADLVTSPEELAEARMKVKSEMFADEQCKRAWSILCDMNDKGEHIDLATVMGRMDEGFVMKSILPATPNAGTHLGAGTHINDLIVLFTRKKAYSFAVKMLQSASSKASSLEDLIALPEEFATTVRSDLNADTDSVAVTKVMEDVVESIEQELQDKREGRRTSVPTGFANLDTILHGGFKAGQLVIIAARPSVGKTAVMLSMAKTAAASGVAVSVFSIEMWNQDLGKRLMQSTGIVDSLKIANGTVDLMDLEIAADSFKNMPLFFNDRVRTLEDIVARIILNHQHGRCDVAMIDYVGLIDVVTDGNKPMHQVVAGITKRLKQVAKDCSIPIIALCQLNRASASENRPPQLYDLRDSGSIEQDADIVLMLERDVNNRIHAVPDEHYSEDALLNMWVRKNRQGKAGDIYIRLQANATYTSFTDLGAKEDSRVQHPTWK